MSRYRVTFAKVSVDGLAGFLVSPRSPIPFCGSLKPQCGRGVHPVRTSLGYVPVHVQYDDNVAVDEVDRMTCQTLSALGAELAGLTDLPQSVDGVAVSAIAADRRRRPAGVTSPGHRADGHCCWGRRWTCRRDRDSASAAAAAPLSAVRPSAARPAGSGTPRHRYTEGSPPRTHAHTHSHSARTAPAHTKSHWPEAGQQNDSATDDID